MRHFSGINIHEIDTKFDQTKVAYPHLSSDMQALSAYLSQSLTQNVPGVNVLFYGALGTGKTELVKALAVSLEADLFEAAYTDADGDSVNGDHSLNAFNLCQQIYVRKPNSMLLFDEVEDVFERQNFFFMMFGGGSNSEKGKAWVNHSLEKSSTPAVCVTFDANIDLPLFQASCRCAKKESDSRTSLYMLYP